MALLNLVDQYESKNTDEYKDFLSVRDRDWEIIA